MVIRFAEVPRKIVVEDPTSETAQLMSAVNQWAREISSAVRALNDEVTALRKENATLKKALNL